MSRLLSSLSKSLPSCRRMYLVAAMAGFVAFGPGSLRSVAQTEKVAVSDGRAARHASEEWARVLGSVALDPGRREELAGNAVGHARRFSWERTTDTLLAAYSDARNAFQREVHR